MKIVLPGGSGQVGTVLARGLLAAGHEVVVLRRTPAAAAWPVVQWDGRTLGEWADHIDGADAVINLAGRNVNCRYNAENRRQIMQSRVDSTRAVGQAIARSAHPPRVWLQTATATIYAHRFDADNDEASGMIGGTEPDAPADWRFSIEVAKAWEAAAQQAATPRTRKVIMRMAMVMSADRGGVFDAFLGLVRHGLGGRQADGRHYMSWIHEADLIGVVLRLIEDEKFAGVVNVTAPNPIPNEQFMRELRAAWGARFGLPAAKWMLEIGAVLIGTETELLLKSRRVTAGILVQNGFEFRFPRWAEAAQDLCARWRNVVIPPLPSACTAPRSAAAQTAARLRSGSAP
ncbi:MAG TPA: TIGR01777 family oxidoreductase [Tepidisphaeraceae bacterium]|nr:TIGR01777 family oxidoreductase [Tepidisphaeraceae bacterium]